MPTLTAQTTSSAWTRIATDATAVLLQCKGDHYLVIDSVAPAVGAPGFFVVSSLPATVQDIGLFGGSAWVRSLLATGSVVYASA